MNTPAMNYFELYGLPVGFRVDKNFLKKTYYALSRKYHPDYFEQGTSITAAENLVISSMVNEGYRLLQDEYSIIGYVLQLEGIITDDGKYDLPPDFLMEIMDLNESFDSGSLSEIETLSAGIKEPVAGLLESETIAHLTENDFIKIKDYYFKEKYLRRLRSRINEQTEPG
jgi:molecular chaperone HscB